MKKEDFVVGDWYVSSEFKDTQAIRFRRFDGGTLVASERVFMRRYSSSNVELKFHQDPGTYRRLDLSEVRTYLPLSHPDKYPLLEEFPEKGFCTYDTQVVEYITKTLKYKQKGSPVPPTSTSMLGWNGVNGLWAVQENAFGGFNKYYVDQLKHFINTNTIKNDTNNEVQRTETEDRITNPDGAARLASRRCQSAVGSRPKGNKAPVNTGRTLVKQSEIKPNIVHTRYI